MKLAQLKVLVADNEPMIADLVELTLGKHGCTVIKVHDTRNIVEVCLDNPDIDLLILDTDCLAGGSVIDIVRSLCDGIKIALYSGGLTGTENPDEFNVDMVVPKHMYPQNVLEIFASLCSAA